MEAVRLNNHAVGLLRRKNVRGAARIFRNAFVDFGIWAANPPPGAGADDGLPDIGALSLGEMAVKIHPDLEEAFVALSPNNEFACYPCAFTLPERGLDPEKISLVILYNLALANHCLGIQTATHETLRKALRLFKKAQSLAVFAGHGHTSGVELVSLATWMNLGFLLSHFLLHREAHECSEQMISFMRSNREALSTEDWIFFFVPNFLMKEVGLLKTAPSA